MIHLIVKSHEGNFQLYVTATKNEEAVSFENEQLHLAPADGDLMTIEGWGHINEIMKLLADIEADESSKVGTIFANYTEDDLSDLTELFEILKTIT